MKRIIALAVLICIGWAAQVRAQQMITVDFSTGQLWHLYTLDNESRSDRYQVVLPTFDVQQEMGLYRPVLGTFKQADYQPTWVPTADMRIKKPSLPPEVRFGQPGHPIGIYRLQITWLNPISHEFWATVRIHGGAKLADLNEAESAGCVRMLDEDIIALVRNIQSASQQGESEVTVSFGYFTPAGTS